MYKLSLLVLLILVGSAFFSSGCAANPVPKEMEEAEFAKTQVQKQGITDSTDPQWTPFQFGPFLFKASVPVYGIATGLGSTLLNSSGVFQNILNIYHGCNNGISLGLISCIDSYDYFNGVSVDVLYTSPTYDFGLAAPSGIANGITIDVLSLGRRVNGIAISSLDFIEGVNGVSLGVLNGGADYKNGLDIVFFTLLGTRDLAGVQIVAVDANAWNESSIEGVQLALFTRSTVDGLQMGIITKNSPGEEKNLIPDAVNIGILNFGEMDGVQFGLFNWLSGGDALQFGLLNYNENGLLPVLPFFNCKWGSECDEEEQKYRLNEKDQKILKHWLPSQRLYH